MLNIFMLTNFFKKSVFSEETAKNCSRGAHFGDLCVITFGPPYICIGLQKKEEKSLEKVRNFYFTIHVDTIV